MCKTSNIVKKWLAFSSIIFGLGLAGNVAANGCISPNATFSSSIGSTATCSDSSGTDQQGNPVVMGGCVVGSGGTSCTYSSTECEFQVNVPLGVGQSQDESTTFDISDPVPGNQVPICQAKIAITQGNQGANYCLSSYPFGIDGDTMTTLSNKGVPVSHKQLEVCTDEIPVTLSPPVISLEKQVVRVIDGAFDCALAVDQLQVIAPTEVAYCFTIRNDGQGTGDNLTLSDPAILQMDVNLGSLPGGNSTPIEYSEVVAITDASEVGEIVNTATVTSTFDGDNCDTCADIDTATVNVVVECDPGTQQQANIVGAVVETRSATGNSRCGPKAQSAGDVDSVSLLCDGSCELRPECGGDLVNFPNGKASLCAQPCKASGNWTYGQNDTTSGGIISNSCTFAEPTPGNLALCQEVLGNPGNNVASCENNKKPTMIRSDGHSITFGSNPILYYFPPGSLGGNSVGITYCILEPGDSPSVCPEGSYVY